MINLIEVYFFVGSPPYELIEFDSKLKNEFFFLVAFKREKIV